MINDYTRNRDINIGDIDIKDKFSFFEVDGMYTSNILEAFKNSKFRGRHINVEIAEALNESGNRKKKLKKK